jgi:hypothetical protein
MVCFNKNRGYFRVQNNLQKNAFHIWKSSCYKKMITGVEVLVQNIVETLDIIIISLSSQGDRL